MRHQIVYVTGFEDWEMLYVDEVQVLQGHRLYPIEILEQIALLEDAFQITVYEWKDELCEDDAPDYIYKEDLKDLIVYLENSTLFEKSVLKVL